MTDQIGRVLGGRYRLIAPIGTGSSAQVFLADDVRLQRRVAVKVLHPALADDQTFLRRFRAEAQASAKLTHPNIVKLWDSGNDDGPYLVTELVGGGSLRGMLDMGHRLSVAQAVGVALEAAKGLDFAHRQGFVHRDIKPANLLFSDDGRLRIADFGVARALAEAAWTEPSGAVLGTARYASPEQAQGQPVTGKGDIYSLSLVLIEAVTGQVPFAADTTIGTLMARVDARMHLGDELGPLAEVLEWAGDPDPGERPAADELGSALIRVSGELDAPDPLPLAGAFPSDGLAPFVDPDPTHLPGEGGAVVVVPDDASSPPAPARGAALAALAARARSALDARRGANGVDANGADRVDANEADEADQVEADEVAGDAVEEDAVEASGSALVDGEGAGQPDDAGASGIEADASTTAGAAVSAASSADADAPGAAADPSRADAVDASGGRDGGPAVGAGVAGRLDTAAPAEVDPRVDRAVPLAAGGSRLVSEADARPGRAERTGEVALAEEPLPPGRRRLPRLVLVAGGVVAVIALVAGALTVRELLRPKHEVPRLDGLDVSEVSALVDGNGWTIERVQTRQDGTTEGEIVDQDPAAGAALREGHTLTVTVSRGPELVAVPENLTGLTQGEAEAALDAVGLHPGEISEKWGELVPAGIVLGESMVYDEVPAGSQVPLVLSKGPKPRPIPEDLAGAGLTFDEVAGRLDDVQLRAVRGEDYSDSVAEGLVIGTSPAGGTLVPRDSEVVVIVSLGPEPVIIPDVAGDTVAEAQAALEAAGLVVDGVEGPPNGIVTGTDPAAGVQVDSGSSIVLVTQRRGGAGTV